MPKPQVESKSGNKKVSKSLEIPRTCTWVNHCSYRNVSSCVFLFSKLSCLWWSVTVVPGDHPSPCCHSAPSSCWRGCWSPAKKKCGRGWGGRQVLITLDCSAHSIKVIYDFNVCIESKSLDCDVGPWGSWTSCYLPPGTCGIGEKNRTRQGQLFILMHYLCCRDLISESKGNGEKCARPRIIEVAETLNCNVACKLPGKYLIIKDK